MPESAPVTNDMWTAAEQANLHTRVIALENLVIALLADAGDAELARARGMAQYISPRAGFTPHPLTLQAAVDMNHMVDRAEHLKAQFQRK
jgi:hypothetical protein